jgi:hypothetical protein
MGMLARGCGVHLSAEPERGRHPKLAAWYREVERLPSMQATTPPAG